MLTTVEPGSAGWLALGLSPDAGITVTPDGLVEKAIKDGQSGHGLRIDLEDLRDAGVVHLIAARRLCQVTVVHCGKSVVWGPQHDWYAAVWVPENFTDLPDDFTTPWHPLTAVAEQVGDAAIDFLGTLSCHTFDPRLWPDASLNDLIAGVIDEMAKAGIPVPTYAVQVAEAALGQWAKATP